MPQLEAQAAAEQATAQAAVEQATVEASELPLQQRMQLFEPRKEIVDEDQQFEDDMAKTKLLSLEDGKRPLDKADDKANIIQLLLDKVSHLENLIKTNANTNAASSATGFVQVHIATPTKEPTTTTPTVDGDMVPLTDELQRLGDSWQSALGHDNLGFKIHRWAQDVINNGKRPKSQIINGTIADVTAVVAAEVERIKNRQQTNINNDDEGDKLNGILNALHSAAGGKQNNAVLQHSPSSVSSHSAANDSNVDNIGDQILAQLGLGMGGNGGGGEDGDDNGGSNVGTTHNDTVGRTNSTRRNEFTLVNPRNITITTLSSRNLNTTPCLPFNNAI